MAFQGDSIYWVEVEKVVPNPFQPRREFDQNKLQELADSIRMYGVLQPLTVTRREVHREDGTFYSEYELIAGERRLRASTLAGVAQVPVIIREGEQSEQEKLELAIIENLQREDLNAVDRALAFKQLSEVFGLSHTQVARKVGRSREYVSNTVRLLALPEEILNTVKQGELTEGHARTLLMLSDRPEEQNVIFKEILLKKLSVREVERIVRKIATDKVRKKNGDFDANLIELEKQFTETLGTRVQILKTDFGGKLTIDYFSNEDLEAILKRIRDEDNAASSASPAEMAESISTVTPLNVATDVTPSSIEMPEAVVEHEPTALEIVPGPVEAVVAEAAPQGAADAPEVESVLHPQPQPETQAYYNQAPVPQTPAVEQQVVTPAHTAEAPMPTAPEPIETPAVPEETTVDDSSLYSIRNFTV